MEQLITTMIENSIIAGSFLYLLYYVVNTQNKTLGQVSTTLIQISETLVHLENRVSKLEKEGK